MSYGWVEGLGLDIYMSKVVQLRLGLIDLLKENQIQELLVVLQVTLKGLGALNFMTPLPSPFSRQIVLSLLRIVRALKLRIYLLRRRAQTILLQSLLLQLIVLWYPFPILVELHIQQEQELRYSYDTYSTNERYIGSS